jgi:cbb3-type cytochrome oxidase maturation protein
MSVIILLIVASLIVGLIFLGAFIWSVRTGQYEDTLTPAMRMLLDDARPRIPFRQTATKSGGKAAPLPVADQTSGTAITPK